MKPALEFFIITITWNNRAGLETTLRSLQSQTYPHWSASVIDGASTDSSVELLETVTEPRIGWQSEKDRGIYDAMNKGIACIPANADFVLFMNAGDSFEGPDTLRQLAENLDGETDLLMGASRNISSDMEGTITRRIRKARPPWWRYIGMPAEHQAMVFSAKLLSKHRFDDRYRMSGDYEHFCRLLASEPRINIRLTDTLICRFAIGGISVTRRSEAEKEEWRIRQEVLRMNPIACHLIQLLQRWRYRYKKQRGQA